jgi:hypothetical protein
MAPPDWPAPLQLDAERAGLVDGGFEDDRLDEHLSPRHVS